MSLTSFLKNKDVKEKFRQEFSKPKFSVRSELLAPPVTNRYALIGTAFDYLMRFYLESLNPKTVTKPWVAMHALALISYPKDLNKERVAVAFSLAKQFDGSNPDALFDLHKKVTDIIKKSKKAHSNYMKSGKMSDELIKSAILLAQVDPIYRAHYVDKNIGIVDDEDIEDLRNLISLVDPETFKANETCALNPTFGEGSQLVGGADVDLIIDDLLIDIKTTKKPELKRDYFDQLIGYYALYKIGGIDGVPEKHEIKSLGIYFSRHGHLHVINVQDVIDKDTFPKFLEWFKERANKEFGS